MIQRTVSSTFEFAVGHEICMKMCCVFLGTCIKEHAYI